MAYYATIEVYVATMDFAVPLASAPHELVVKMKPNVTKIILVGNNVFVELDEELIKQLKSKDNFGLTIMNEKFLSLNDIIFKKI